MSVTVPANTTTATKTYTFALSAKGSTTVKASPVTVTVAGVAAAVTSFTATSHGAAIDLAAKVTGATSCAFSVTPTVSGLPKTVTCSGGSATATVTVPANKGSAPIAYTFTLTATGTSSTATKTATVFVGPALTSIALAPADSTLTVGGTQQYVVDGYVGNTLVGEYTGGFTLTLTPDAENYPQPAGTTYSCSDSSLPTCTSTWAGDFAVSASGDGLTTTTDGDADLTVDPGPVASLTIDPTTDQVEAGEDEVYDVEGFDEYMNPIDAGLNAADPPLGLPDVALSIDAAAGTNPSDGVCNGLDCYAFDAGVYTVVASDGDISSPPATLTVVPSDPVSLTVTPNTSTITAGTNTSSGSVNVQDYTISGADKYGNEIPSITDGVSLYINDGDDVCNDADDTTFWCASDAVGTWTVTATVTTDDDDGTETTATGYAQLTVNPGSIQLTSPDATFPAGYDEPFAVEAFDSQGNDIGPLDNGFELLSINTPSGSCNAVSMTCTVEAIGTFTVTATYGTAAPVTEKVTVVPAGLQVTPGTSSIAAGSPQGYTVTALDINENPVGPDPNAILSIDTTPDIGSCVADVCTASVPGVYSVTAKDGAADPGMATLTVTAGTITQGAPTSGSTTPGNSTGFTDQLATTGQTGPVTFKTTTSATGIAVSASGAISVSTQLNAGAYTVSGTDSDTSGDTGTWSYTLTVAGGTITQGAPTSGSTTPGNSTGFTDQLATTGQTGPVTFVTTVPAAGIAVSASGAISVSTQLNAGAYTVSGTDSDTSGDTGTWSYTLTVAGGTITQGAPTSGSTTPGNSTGFTDQLATTGQTGPVTFVTTVPAAGIAVSASGAISVSTQLNAGAYTVSGTDSDTSGDTGTWSYTLTVAGGTITQGAPTSGSTTPGNSTGFTDQLATTGQTGPVTFVTTVPAAGIAVSASGAISVSTQLNAGAYTVSGTDSDTSGDTGTWSYTLTVAGGTITQGAPTSGSTTPGNSTGFTDQLATTGQTGPVTFVTTVPAAGIAVSASGAISVSTQLNAGAYTVSGTDSDTSGDTGTWSYTLTVAGGTITQGAPTSGSTTPGNSTGFTDQLATTGQTGPVTFVTTVPAAGIAVSASGAISVSTQLNAGAYTVSGTDSDTSGDTGTWSYTLTVAGGTITQGTPTLGATTSANSLAFTAQLATTGQTGPVTFVTTVPAAGIAVSASGAISVSTQLNTGTYPISGTDSDTNGDTGTWSYTLTVTPPNCSNIPTPPAELYAADFAYADLIGCDLQDANLRYANLNDADLEDSNFTGADLQQANLVNAPLNGADLQDANLFEADLQDANLYAANLTGANVLEVVWGDTTCPDGTNSNADLGTCANHLGQP